MTVNKTCPVLLSSKVFFDKDLESVHEYLLISNSENLHWSLGAPETKRSNHAVDRLTTIFYSTLYLIYILPVIISLQFSENV